MSALAHRLVPITPRLPLVDLAEVLGARFVFESCLPGHSLSRMSYVGVHPFATFRAKRQITGMTDVVFARDGHDEQRFSTEKPMEALRSVLKAFQVPTESYVTDHIPLLSGAVGYVGYGARHFFSKLPERLRAPAPDADLPDIWFGLFDDLIIRDEASGETWLSVISRDPSYAAAHARASARAETLKAHVEGIAVPVRPKAHTPAAAPKEVPVEEVRGRYEAEVRVAKEHIARGDLFEVCLTRRIVRPFLGNRFALYRAMKDTSPAPFASMLSFEGGFVVSASPERFVSLDRAGVAETRPIKGTRKRGSSHDEDSALSDELRKNPKDRAEHTMAVDVARNDLGRVCTTSSVKVTDFQRIEKHPAVFQMVSDVSGKLAPHKDAVDLISATFPGASMTGAPKVQSMKLIDELEETERGIYSGAIGYIDFSGTMDLSMAIRGVVVHNGLAIVGTGGAIVADSDPAAEFEETVLKANAMLTALKKAQ